MIYLHDLSNEIETNDRPVCTIKKGELRTRRCKRMRFVCEMFLRLTDGGRFVSKKGRDASNEISRIEHDDGRFRQIGKLHVGLV